MKKYLWIGFLMAASAAMAQRPDLESRLIVPVADTVQILTLHDGTVLNGVLVGKTDSEVIFKTSVGEIKIAKVQIKDIKSISTALVRNGEYWFPNPNATRLFFSPTGRMLKQGDGYFQNIYIFFIGGAYGITDNITIGGGSSIVPGTSQIYYFTPKIGFQVTENLNLAAGTLFMGSTEANEHAGIHYLVGSMGSAEGSLTVGLGYGYSGSHVSDRPIIVLGGEKRLWKRFAFVTENWLIPESEAPLASFGFRFLGESMAVDLAFIRPLNSGSGDLGLGFPYVDFVINIK